MEISASEILAFTENISEDIGRSHGLNRIIVSDQYYSILIQTDITILIICKKVTLDFDFAIDQLNILVIDEIRSKIPENVSAAFIHYCRFDIDNKCKLQKEQQIK